MRIEVVCTQKSQLVPSLAVYCALYTHKMTNGAHFSQRAPLFHGAECPEEGTIVGYAAIVASLDLKMPMVRPMVLVSDRNRRSKSKHWLVLPNRYLPEDTRALDELTALYKHLVFALKYEGVNLLVFKFLTKHYSEHQLAALVSIEATGQYSRRIWFILEWLLGKQLEGKAALSKKGYVPVLDSTQQFAVAGEKVPRHMVINNLPGTPDFCPLVWKSKKLQTHLERDLSAQKNDYLEGVRKELIQRASAFLLLKDSKASFSIEGESPKSRRAARWGQAIGQAGSTTLSVKELERLQQLVIENPRFVAMGFRVKGGFVGEHDRVSGEPLPAHISARWQDLPQLMQGLLDANKILIEDGVDAVVAAATIAFGFVFIHPFEDGNGRLHRYLIHHVLSKKRFSQQGLIFPVSATILDRIDEYRQVLEAYSTPLLDWIEWRETSDHNVEVLNNTIDYYRYFNATLQAEFLYDCVLETVEKVIPQEFDYLNSFDAFKRAIEEEFEMPDRLIALLVRFLEQNQGVLSKRARTKEFMALSDAEVQSIERLYQEVFVQEEE